MVHYRIHAYVMASLFSDVLQRKPKISRRLFVAPFQIYSLVRCEAVIWYVCSSEEPARSIIYADKISQPISNIITLPRFIQKKFLCYLSYVGEIQ